MEQYRLRFGHSGKFYTTTTGESHWTFNRAVAVAKNLSAKRNVTITLVKVEDVITDESPFDRIVAYVDTLKGKRLTIELCRMNLPIGGDPVASKRQRLITHFTKYGYNPRQGK